MPIFRSGDKLIYFCHVPKCGGTSINRYLAARYGRVAFFDGTYHSNPDPWCRTSPQHIAADDHLALFPAGFFDAAFTVVRNPVTRILSEFYYLRDRLKMVSGGRDFSEWLREILAVYYKGRFTLDNHLRPMCEMVPPGARVFKLENGLEQIVAYLDQLTSPVEGFRTIERHQQKDPTSETVRLAADDVALIETFYARDYDRFNYERGNPMEG